MIFIYKLRWIDMRQFLAAGLSLLLMAAAPPPPASPLAPAMPQQTTASFGDWTLRCVRDAQGQNCEVVQSINSHGKLVAEVALGRVGKTKPLHLTMMTPPSVSFNGAPVLVPGHEGVQTPLTEMVWRRCLPGSCIAETTLKDDMVHRLRLWSDSGRILFLDAAGRTAALPFSPAGLAPALDALAKVDGS